MSESDTKPETAKQKKARLKTEKAEAAKIKKAEAEAAKIKKAEAEALEAAAKLEIPKFFTDPSKVPTVLPVEALEAEAFIFGLEPYKKSYSANITYVGPRRKIGRKIILAKKGLDPTKLGGFKLYNNACIFWAKKANTFMIKDLGFIQEAYESSNFTVEWVEDPPLDRKSVKRQVFQRSRTRILGLPIQIKAQYVKAGQKIDLNPGDPQKILEIIKRDGIKKENEHMLGWLKEQLKKESQT